MGEGRAFPRDGGRLGQDPSDARFPKDTELRPLLRLRRPHCLGVGKLVVKILAVWDPWWKTVGKGMQSDTQGQSPGSAHSTSGPQCLCA